MIVNAKVTPSPSLKKRVNAKALAGIKKGHTVKIPSIGVDGSIETSEVYVRNKVTGRLTRINDHHSANVVAKAVAAQAQWEVEENDGVAGVRKKMVPVLPPSAMSLSPGELLPVDEGPAAVRRYIQRRMVERGISLDTWLDTLEEARTEAARPFGKGTMPDHRTRMKAAELEMSLAGVTFGGRDVEAEGASLAVNVNITESGGDNSSLSPKEQIAALLLRARAIAAGAKNDEQVARYIASSPTPDIPDAYVKDRQEAEGILSHFTPVIPFQDADEEEFSNSGGRPGGSQTCDREGSEGSDRRELSAEVR